MNILFGATYAYDVSARVLQESTKSMSIDSDRELTNEELKQVILNDGLEGVEIVDVYDEDAGPVLEVKDVTNNGFEVFG